jgi:hypothetical protein
MKNKIFIGIAICLVTAATVFNINLAEQNKAGNVSLDAIAVMAQAQSESPIGRYCTEGIKYTGSPNAAVRCSNCQLYFGYIGIGAGGSCF